mmetsp:Transcript_20582/g.32183  ORF Transcript_20582/g.32183 Transcript_20582/m.32183 type:complete len:116 (-) Transcript_20582:550-897(-)
MTQLLMAGYGLLGGTIDHREHSKVVHSAGNALVFALMMAVMIYKAFTSGFKARKTANISESLAAKYVPGQPALAFKCSLRNEDMDSSSMSNKGIKNTVATKDKKGQKQGAAKKSR